MKTRTFSGFTLIEVMIAVVVIAILAAIAYPSYTDHLRKGRRAEGKNALLKAAQLQERYFTENNHYADDSPQAGRPTFQSLFGAACTYPVGSAENCADGGYYRISVVLQPSTTPPVTQDMLYTMTATPNPAGWDAECGFFRITNTGVRTWETMPNNAAKCRW